MSYPLKTKQERHKMSETILKNQAENEATNLSPADLEETIECESCGEQHPKSEMTKTADAENICQSCLDDSYSYCEFSDQYALASEFTEVTLNNGQKAYCFDGALSDHFHECDDCGSWVESTITAHNSRGREIEICNHCLENESYYTCDSCGDIYHGEFTENVDDGNETVCRHCIENGEFYYHERDGYYSRDPEENEDDDGDNLINDYSYKPTPIFKGQSSHKMPSCGLELEIETGDNKIKCAEICHNSALSNRIYLKNDGSLANGFEIVTHPSTLLEHKKEAYRELFEALSKAGAKSHDTKTCGLHFHIETKHMTENHKIRLGMFFTLCQSELEILARRKESTYATFKKNDELNMTEFQKYKNDDRYAALNWQNSKTVEFRIFKGTLKYETFMASMQLCYAAYTFTIQKTSMAYPLDNSVIFKRFLKHITKNKELYGELIEYLKSKNFKNDNE
jgi:hypothetical protein